MKLEDRVTCQHCDNKRWHFCNGMSTTICYFCGKDDPHPGSGTLSPVSSMTKEEFTDEKSIEWLDGQDGCCSCHIVAPCSFCEDGFSLPLAEYLELALEDEFGPEYAETVVPHADFDRAIRDLL